jgi:hypothetical protein
VRTAFVWLACGTVALVAGWFTLPALRQALQAHGSKSSVLAPLLYLAALLLAGVLGAVYVGAPALIVGVMLSLLGADVALIMVMYVVFVARNRSHELRSETYALQHQLLEKGLLGDSARGVIDVEGTSTDITTTATSTALVPVPRGSPPTKPVAPMKDGDHE